LIRRPGGFGRHQRPLGLYSAGFRGLDEPKSHRLVADVVRVGSSDVADRQYSQRRAGSECRRHDGA
jgi:hypothetical protein